MAYEASKQAAARAAALLVENNMRVGLGTGSTSEFFVRALAERVQQEGLKISAFPTSEHILNLAKSLGIPIMQDYPNLERLDIACDGADEVDPHWNLIKGGGAALLREKLVARAAKQFVVMVDQSKHVARLGQTFRLPVEVIPFAWEATCQAVQQGPGVVRLEWRMQEGEPKRTDHNNFVVDLTVDGDVAALHHYLKAQVGVVETGFFGGMTHTLITGSEDASAQVEHFSGD